MLLTKRKMIAGFAALLSTVAAPAVAQDWPDGRVTLIVPWGAGGGTDATARMIGALLEERIGVPVAVENRTGGSGVIGHAAIASAAPDGQTIGVATLEIGTMHNLGLTDLDHTAYTPLGLYNSDPAAVFVNTRSDHTDIGSLLAALEAAPDREFKASGSAQGGVNHLALAGMLMAAGMPAGRVAWVPSEGAAPGLQDLAAGGVEVATASLPEAAALMEAGLIRPLAVFSDARLDIAPDVPTFTEASGHEFALGSWRGLVAPAGLAPDVAEQITSVLGEVLQDPEYTSFMSGRGYAMQWTTGADFEAFMRNSDAALGDTLRAVGLSAQ
ncbi:Bug family tripartite tricarboxylate transporter substrate binding protein [Roseicitreum antarcticum]|uniref:Tripartite-type tricarboxylate transporter, receptor component TctC n=1 Tax=Roseicitreum antarcticum TaxID=564137 RepID=A0A1H2VHR7_9RHOB|nr:tripartite tricarboxylate transporter substrate binding protein [Roseicitreum antarcticum]SDW67863.1 Tripartite-type tricarboxylate transporter, receptor component TctC [Roseicitreum antarcticum]